jgi:hypothetical protein
MKYTSLFLLLVSGFIFSACHRTPTEPKPSTKQLVGAWNWILSEGGIYPRHETPENTHYVQTLDLRADSTATLTRTPDSSNASYFGLYRTARRYNVMTSDTSYFIGIFPLTSSNTEPNELLQFHGPDTMLIGDMAADGIQSTYVRKH